jgi:hypothetical protein
MQPIGILGRLPQGRSRTGTDASPSAMADGYRPLHKYLHDRYADSVVLTFAEIEDLLGFALPEPARVEPAWWASADVDGRASPQSQSWTQADRTATPRLLAEVVVFERTPA